MKILGWYYFVVLTNSFHPCSDARAGHNRRHIYKWRIIHNFSSLKGKLTSLNFSEIEQIFGAFSFLSSLVHAWPRNSLWTGNLNIGKELSTILSRFLLRIQFSGQYMSFARLFLGHWLIVPRIDAETNSTEALMKFTSIIEIIPYWLLLLVILTNLSFSNKVI